MEISLIGGKAAVFSHTFADLITSVTQRTERKPKAKKGRGKWQMKERG